MGSLPRHQVAGYSCVWMLGVLRFVSRRAGGLPVSFRDGFNATRSGTLHAQWDTALVKRIKRGAGFVSGVPFQHGAGEACWNSLSLRMCLYFMLCSQSLAAVRFLEKRTPIFETLSADDLITTAGYVEETIISSRASFWAALVWKLE